MIPPTSWLRPVSTMSGNELAMMDHGQARFWNPEAAFKSTGFQFERVLFVAAFAQDLLQPIGLGIVGAEDQGMFTGCSA